MTMELRKEMIEEQHLDIPFDSKGFTTWLVNSEFLSANAAAKQIELIRKADLELWSPGDVDYFSLIAKWIGEAHTMPETKGILSGFTIEIVNAFIDELNEMKEDVADSSQPLLKEMIAAVRLYKNYLIDLLEVEDDETEAVEVPSSSLRYPEFYLEDEFREYLDSQKHTSGTRNKMMSNLRKLNALLGNTTERGWLKNLADEAAAGASISSMRRKAVATFDKMIAFLDDTPVTKDAAQGAYSATQGYINFLSHAQKHHPEILTPKR